jgi:hypothetical protein
MTQPDASRAPRNLHRQQMEFARHLRDPDSAPAPDGIEARRLQVYRELFYNNVEGLLAAAYPVIRRLLGDERWHGLVRDFYREHRATTPLFPEVSRELLRFLQARMEAGAEQPDFLLELAHYEWAELALELDEAELEPSPPAALEDLLYGVPLLSPLAWPLAYRYPVQRISREFQPSEPPPDPTFLLLQRDADGKVRFSQIEAVGYALLTRIGANQNAQAPLSGRALLSQLASDSGSEDIESFVSGGAAMMARLNERLVLGVAKSS